MIKKVFRSTSELPYTSSNAKGKKDRSLVLGRSTTIETKSFAIP